MLENFTRARIDSLTLGERLERLRLEQQMDTDELAQNLRVRSSYIEALEKGDYQSLPTKVYVRGFISAYARYFNVPEKKLVKIFDKEYRIYENIHRKKEPQNETIHRLPALPKIVITSQTLIFSIIFLAVGLAVFYLYSSIKSFNSAPWLIMKEPPNGVSTDKQEIIVSGETKNDAKVYINDQLVAVGLDGIFSEKVGLSQGQNNIVVKSVNKFDKAKIETIIVNAKFPEVIPITDLNSNSGNNDNSNQESSSDNQNSTDEKPADELIDEEQKDENKDGNETENEKKQISLKIKADDDILLKVIADDNVVFNDILKKNKQKEFFATEKIVISTDSGKDTLVSFENENFKNLSDKNSSVKNFVFEKKGDLDN